MIEVSAVCLFDDLGRVLTVRKRHTCGWMLVGGKPEDGETAKDCVIREVAEELGVTLDPDALSRLGDFRSTAVNEHVPLVAHVFVSQQRVTPSPHAEIAELRWVDPADPGPDQAPLNTDLVFPLVTRARTQTTL